MTERNEKCPCGSGKKYKKCCMNKPKEIGVLQTIFKDKGTGDDFIARMLFGMMEIRDHVFSHTERETFDKFYDPIYQNLLEAEFSKDHCKAILEKHVENIESGISSEIKDNQININENIELELNIAYKDFFIRGGIALSYLVRFADFLGYNISFIYQKDKDFEAGLKKFAEKHDTPIMKILLHNIKQERSGWYSPFRMTRNKIEHEGWKLPPIKYNLENGKIVVVIPRFDNNHSLVEGLEFLWQRLMNFCEEMVVLLLSQRLKPPLVLMQIPKAQRNPEVPVRFKVTFLTDMTGWNEVRVPDL